MALVLLSTLGCHLCDEAQALLLTLQGQIKTDVFVEDIAESDELVARYGIRIPVLQHEESGAELDWPFDVEILRQWLIQHDCL